MLELPIQPTIPKMPSTIKKDRNKYDRRYDK